MLHAAAVKGRVDDDLLDGDDQGSHPGPQHRPQAHSPVGRTGVTENSANGEFVEMFRVIFQGLTS